MLRSWGLLALLPLLALEWVNITDHVSGMYAHPAAALDAANGVTIPLDPLVAGLVCAETLAVTRGSRWEMVTSLPDNGLRMLAGRVLATAGWCALLHVGVVGFVLWRSTAYGSSDLPSLWPVVPALLSVFAYAALGAAIGRAWPSLLAPPVCAVGLYVVAGYVESHGPDPLVQFGGATADLVGLQYRPDVLAAQSIWLAVIAVGALVAAVSTVRGYPRLATRGTACLVVVACCAAWLASLGGIRFEPAQMSYTCRGHHPKVCVFTSAEQHLDQQYHRVSDAVQTLRMLNVPLPDVYKQRSAEPGPPPTGVATFSFASGESPPGAHPQPFRDLVRSIALSTWCRDGSSPPWPDIRSVISWAVTVHKNPDMRASANDHPNRARARQAWRSITSCG